MNNKTAKKMDLSDDAIAELEKFDTYDREGTNIPPTPETRLQTDLVERGLLEEKNIELV